MTMEAVMYGYTPRAATLMLRSAPPLNRFRKPRIALSSNACSRSCVFTPGMGMCATNRNTTSSPMVKSSFRRMSGCWKASRTAWSSRGLLGGVCALALAGLATAVIRFLGLLGLRGLFLRLGLRRLAQVLALPLLLDARRQLFDGATRGLDLGARGCRDAVSAHGKGGAHVAVSQQLDRPPERAHDALFAQGLRRHLAAGGELGQVPEVHRSVFDSKRVVEPSAAGEPSDERSLPPFKPGPRALAGAGLLSLDSLSGVGAMAACVAAADALAPLPSAWRGSKLVLLHGYSSASSTASRCCTFVIIPRTEGESLCSTVWPSLRRPRARIVRFWSNRRREALRTQRTRSLLIGGLLRRRGSSRPSERLPPRDDFLGHTKAGESFERGLHHVDRVVAAERLGEHISDARRLQDGAHATAGNDAGARRGGLQQHLRRAVLSEHRVRDGAVLHWHLDQAPAGDGRALADSVRHLVGLAQAEADAPLPVAYDHDGAEVESTPALHHLGDAVDVQHLLGELRFAFQLVVGPSGNH